METITFEGWPTKNEHDKTCYIYEVPIKNIQYIHYIYAQNTTSWKFFVTLSDGNVLSIDISTYEKIKEYLNNKPQVTPENMQKTRTDDVQAALKEFKNAALKLNWCMERNNISDIKNYPKYLPSFDEFAFDTISIEIEDGSTGGKND